MAKATSCKELLAQFFDEGAYTPLYAEGAVTAAFGTANGQSAYAVCQNGEPVCAKDVERAVKVLELAAKTGNPVVTFYNSTGAKLEEGLDALSASASLSAAVAKLSGVVPQIAVVTGVCGAGNALAAAAADVCIMAKEGELFLTPPFTAAANGDKTQNAGSAAAAAKAGVATIVTEDAAAAAKKASELVGMLPANNLTGADVFEPSAPAAALNLAKYEQAAAAQSILDGDSAVELYADFGKKAYTALGLIDGSVAGVIATAGEKESLCRNATAKIARFVRLCDAFSIPIVTIINTDGFTKSAAEDIAGGLREAARLAGTYADATTAKIAVVAGKAVGAAYTALANADVTIAVNGCTIAPVEPSVAASILYKEEIDGGSNIAGDTAKLAATYAAETCSAAAALASGAADFAVDAASVRETVVAALTMLATKRTQRLPKKHGNMAL